MTSRTWGLQQLQTITLYVLLYVLRVLRTYTYNSEIPSKRVKVWGLQSFYAGPVQTHVQWRSWGPSDPVTE